MLPVFQIRHYLLDWFCEISRGKKFAAEKFSTVISVYTSAGVNSWISAHFKISLLSLQQIYVYVILNSHVSIRMSCFTQLLPFQVLGSPSYKQLHILPELQRGKSIQSGSAANSSSNGNLRLAPKGSQSA